MISHLNLRHKLQATLLPKVEIRVKRESEVSQHNTSGTMGAAQ